MRSRSVRLLVTAMTLTHLFGDTLVSDAALTFSRYRMLAARSRLAEHFGVSPANVLFAPDYEQRALQSPKAAVFNTVVEPLK